MPVHIKRVRLKNFRNFEDVDVELSDLTILVGPNASGKSNFVDALRLVSDALNSTLENALRDRGGAQAVRFRTSGYPRNFEISLDIDLDLDTNIPEWDGPWNCVYTVEIGAGRQRPSRFEIRREVCGYWVVDGLDAEGVRENSEHDTSRFFQPLYETRGGKLVRKPFAFKPAVRADRLLLPSVAGEVPLYHINELLHGIAAYALIPERIRDVQDPDPGLVLRRDGSNAASVLRNLIREKPQDYERLCALLRSIAPGVVRVEPTTYGPKEGLVFFQQMRGRDKPTEFPAQNMSDGTLRAFGVLLALYQHPTPPLIIIEEPEATINPGVAGVLVASLIDASKRTQVLVTTHSPDVLDHKDLRIDQIRVVYSVGGVGRISRIRDGALHAIQEQLYTPGELLRMNELVPPDEDERFPPSVPPTPASASVT